MARKHKKSFDLYSSFGYWTPDVRGIIVLLALLAAGVCAASFISLLIGKAMGQNFCTGYGILITYPLQFIPAMLYASFKSHRNEGFDAVPNEIDSSRFAPFGAALSAILAVFCTLSLAVIVEPVMAILPEMPQRLKAIMESLADGPVWVALLSTAVMAPFFEEWLCRGMIMRGLLSKTGPATAIIISAAIFAIMHANPWQAVPAFIIGCLLGLVYWKTGSLKLTMLMHCANNATSILLSQIPEIKDNDYIYQAFTGHIAYYCLLLVLCTLTVTFVVRAFIRTDFSE